MRLAYLTIIMLLAFGPAGGQERRLHFKEPVNQLDQQQQRTGLWYIVHPALRGEPTFSEFGRYANGQKEGIWTTLDAMNRLKAKENYMYGVRNGQAKYYDKGRLALTGTYRGLNPKYEYDTIMVTDPISLLDREVVVHSDQGSLRHGTWRYFDPRSGVLLRVEEYQVDSLLYTKKYNGGTVADSVYMAQRRAQLPHIQDPKGRHNPPYKSLTE